MSAQAMRLKSRIDHYAKTEFTMKENLVQGDLPILEFRKRRDLLKKGNDTKEVAK